MTDERIHEINLNLSLVLDQIMDDLGERPDAIDGARIIEGNLGAIQVRLCEPFIDGDPSDPEIPDQVVIDGIARAWEHQAIRATYGEAVIRLLDTLASRLEEIMPGDSE